MMGETEILKLYGELVGVTGWPEWSHGQVKFALQHGGNIAAFRRCIWIDGEVQKWIPVGDAYDDHEALCLWRDHVRTWIEGKGYGLSLTQYEDVKGDVLLEFAVTNLALGASSATRHLSSFDEALLWGARYVTVDIPRKRPLLDSIAHPKEAEAGE